MLVLGFFAAAALGNRVRVGARLEKLRGWTQSDAPCTDSEVKMTVYLKQQGLDDLTRVFEETSDPNHVEYGNFLTKEAVDALVYAEPKAFEAVGGWLKEHSVEYTTTSDTIVVNSNCVQVSKLLHTPMHTFSHSETGFSRPLIAGVMTVPADVKNYIDFIGGVSEMWEGFVQKHSKLRRGGKSKPYESTDPIDLKITPKLLKQYYGIPDNETNTNIDNYQAILAFDDYYSRDALNQFWENTDGGLGSTPTLKEAGVNCLQGSGKKCDQVESDLDVQYITAIGSGVTTLFHGTQSSDGWVLTKTENLLQLLPLPKVMSVSYGWSELGQCDIAFSECLKLGYSSTQYVQRTDTNFQRLAVQGASIMVSDGDDGAQGVQPLGWDPLDPDYWCPGNEYTCYPKGGLKSKCGQIVLHNTTTGDLCPYPVGHMNDACTWIFLGDFYQDEDIENALKAANPNCGLEFFLDGSYNAHMWSDCDCSAMSSLVHEDVRSQAMQQPFNPSGKFFAADYPTSSSYVTSVGATRFTSDDGSSVKEEIVASVKTGSIITSGGGFSVIQTTPSWQASHVSAWATSATDLPPSSKFSTSGRGYPDVTWNGHNYQVYYTNDGGENCPCKVGGVDGTSASSPAFSGMMSLINGRLMNENLSPLGFLNPLFYGSHSHGSVTFNDVTSGDNKCTRSFCMRYGYSAATGWDPASGLGSAKFPELLSYSMKLKRRAAARRARIARVSEGKVE